MTDDDLEKALRTAAIGIFPTDAVTLQKGYLNYESAKPNKMSARDTATRFKRLNDWFEYYPSDGVDRLQDVKKIEDRDMCIIYYNKLMPVSWRRKLDENNLISPYDCELVDLVDFAERMQITEQRYGGTHGGVLKGAAVKQRSTLDGMSGSSYGGPASGAAKRDESHERKKNSKDCLVHGEACGHGTHQCKVIKSYATKYRAAWDSKPRDKYPAAKKRQEYKNKQKSADRTWTRAEVQAIAKKYAKRHENLNIEADPSDSEEFAKIFEDLHMSDKVDMMDSDSD
ncbi:MAG: hypothetical protein ACKO14_01625 [Armatimonadota bacterium]